MPLSELGLEFILGLGAALFAGNAWALAKPALDRRSGRKPAGRVTSPRRVWLNMAIGAIVAAWALVSLVARR